MLRFLQNFGPELSRLCCEKGSPWDECYTGGVGADIPDEVIRRYYEFEMVVPELPKQDGLS